MSPLTPKQKDLYDYIVEFTDQKGYSPTQQEMATKFGWSSLGTVQNYLVRLIREGVLATDWNAKRGFKAVRQQQSAVELPLVGLVAAGKPIEAIETSGSIVVPASMVGPGENFVLLVQGDSMVGDGILDGDYVVVRKQSQANSGQTVVAVIRGEATVKRMVRREQRIELHPANPTMQPFIIDDEEDFRIEGVVVGVIRHCK